MNFDPHLFPSPEEEEVVVGQQGLSLAPSLEKRSNRMRQQDLKKSGSNPSAAPQRAFSNALIVRKIVTYVSPSTALALRQVSKILAEEVTFFLLSNERAQKTVQVKFSWESSDSVVVLGHFEHAYMGTLSEFVESCWATSRRFPVRNFSFDGGSLGSKDVLDFFTKVGHYIKGLTLNLAHQDFDLHFKSGRTYIPVTIRVLATILYDLTPNLKHLDLVCTPWEPDLSLFGYAKLDPKNRVLPSLRTLTLQGPETNPSRSVGVVRDILNSAPNLQRIFDPQLKFTEVLVECQKIHLGSKVFKWAFSPNSNNTQFYTFADTRPTHLHTIDLDFGDISYSIDTSREMGRALSNILQGSCESLERIERLPFLGCIDNVQPLPVMEKVKLVRFYHYSRTLRNGVLSPDDTLEKVFPQLETLGLYQLLNYPVKNPLFQENEAHRHDGVTTLELAGRGNNFVQDSWIQRAALHYPNLTCLDIQIHGLETLPGICRAIWAHFDSLEHLIFRLMFTKNTVGAKLPGEMDSAMTGIPLKLCKELRRNMSMNSEENVDHLRTTPSILNLRQLKTFTVKNWDLLQKYEKLFSWVSTVYAFRPMIKRQKLKVIFNSQTCGNMTYVKCS